MKLIILVVLGALLLGGFGLVFSLISGLVSIVSGAFNAILGIAVIIALILIVLWMFSYAKRNR